MMSFNPTLVRLRLRTAVIALAVIISFNPTLVRLRQKKSNRSWAITSLVSIPRWFD